jgi:hypothetical protein
MFEVSHLIASCASVDGATLLTQRLELLGFGAEIAGALTDVPKWGGTRWVGAADWGWRWGAADVPAAASLAAPYPTGWGSVVPSVRDCKVGVGRSRLPTHPQRWCDQRASAPPAPATGTAIAPREDMALQDGWRSAAIRSAGFALMITACGLAEACVRVHQSAVRWLPALADGRLERYAMR